MESIFHPRAALDAKEIASPYADISDQLVERFWAELDEAIDAIESRPSAEHFDPSGFLRRSLKKLPYHILYEEGPSEIRIMVIRHHHRNPNYGTRRR